MFQFGPERITQVGILTRVVTAMTLSPDQHERLARARADLRMGVPVVLEGETSALVIACETLTPQRLADILALGGEPVLAITARRA